MSNVGDLLLSSGVSHVVDLSWQVVIAEILEVEVVELLVVFISLQFNVLSGMMVTSVISEPDIVAGMRKLECWGLSANCPNQQSADDKRPF